MAALEIPTAPVFKPLLSPARYKGAFGGRGSGKSWHFASSVVEYAMTTNRSRIVCVREVQRSLKESVKQLVQDQIAALGVESYFRILDDRIETPGGGLISFQGMRDHTAESIKSLEGFSIAYVEEAQTLTARSLEMLRPTIRTVGSEIWFSWNPRSPSDPVDRFLRGPTPPADAIVVRASYRDNPWFPEELEGERRHDEVTNPTRYAHIWLGDYEPMAVGALWNMEMVERHRRAREDMPDMKRIVVSIDPAGSVGENANETGIVVAGIGEDGRGYVLDDLTMVGGPRAWAERAVAAYDLYSADAIVAEVNYGGDMVARTIRAVRSEIRVIEVRAAPGRGKHVRAEPIAALYALGKVSHVGAFPQLESQLCLITPEGYKGAGSPDRADSLVWAMSELFQRIVKRKRPDGRPPPKAALGKTHGAFTFGPGASRVTL